MQPELAWQGSLFHSGPVTAADFSRLHRIQLDDRSWVDHVPGWLAGSDDLFQTLLRTGRWQQRQVHIYDRSVPEPRLTAGWDVDADSVDMPPALRTIADRLSTRYHVDFDRIWVNLYRDGRDSVAWHGDRNAKVLTNPLVATVSLGARRHFQLRSRGSGRITTRLDPGHGDLIVMGGACQHDWEHCVPKQAKVAGPRMSVTIRHSQPAAGA